MVSGDSIALFAPILFLLVTELSNIARDTVPLEKIASQERPAVQVLGWNISPNLGRFFFIHWGSMMLLSVAVFTTLNFTDGILAGGLLTGTAILLYFYPIFEVKEYDSLLKQGRIPSSYRNHLMFVSLIIGLSIVGPTVIRALHVVGVGILGIVYLALVFTILPFIAARQFTKILRSELSSG